MDEITADMVLSDVPQIVHSGVYTLWRKPDGTLRVQYRAAGEAADGWFEMPADMVRLYDAAMSGKMKPAELLRASMAMIRKMV